jgi:hypothetical protein
LVDRGALPFSYTSVVIISLRRKLGNKGSEKSNLAVPNGQPNDVMTRQPTVQEVRKTQDAQLERLRTLQRDKPLAPLEQRERIQREIDVVTQEIRNLDAIIAGLLKPSPK